MFKSKYTIVLGLLLATVVLAVVYSTAFAAFNNEPFESENYYSYGGSKNGVFSLTYLGIGGGKCDSNDRRFRVNVNSSYRGSDWKLYSATGRYRRTPSGRVPYGYELDNPKAHICVGVSEFNWILYPFSYWTTSGAQSNVYTWRR